MSSDKAGKQYWDTVWNELNLPRKFEPRKSGLRNYIDRRFHDYFATTFRGMKTQDMRLLEVGCGSSRWLPYLATEFGFTVSGIDYSEEGCVKAEKMLARSAVHGDIVHADFLSPPDKMLEAFDVVVSFGVAEHFDDTENCIKAFSAFLKPGGIMITSIPNLSGLTGWFIKLLDRRNYDVHKIIDKDDFRKAHERAGLKLLKCDYFIFSNFAMLIPAGFKFSTMRSILQTILISPLIVFSVLTWLIETKVGAFRENRALSGFINCVSQKITSDSGKGQ